MAYDPRLADRIRIALTGVPGTGEVAMFGGLSFTINGRILVSADQHGDLMIRCAPHRADQLLAKPGASRAVIGRRTMSQGWIAVTAEACASQDEVDAWIHEVVTTV